MKVFQLINDKGNGVVNQFMISNTNGVFFQSYDTMCAAYSKGRVYLNEDYFGGDFDNGSNTTNKHLYIFLRKYTPYYTKNKKDILNSIQDKTFQFVSETELKSLF